MHWRPRTSTSTTVVQLTDSFGDQANTPSASRRARGSPAPAGPRMQHLRNGGQHHQHARRLRQHPHQHRRPRNTTSYTYDSNNNVVSVSKPLNSATTATTSYTYNSFGEVLTSTDALGNTTTNTYDAHGNFVQSRPRAQWQHRRQRDAVPVQRLGEMTQITDPKATSPSSLTRP